MAGRQTWQVFALMLALEVSGTRVNVAQTAPVPGTSASEQWVGEMKGPAGSAFGVRTSPVLLRVMGSRLSGSWGVYTLAGSVEEGHIEISLTDASGTLAGQLRGRVGQNIFYGNGSMAPVQVPGAASVAALEWNTVSWTLMRDAGTRSK